jgi:hypothetical protein
MFYNLEYILEHSQFTKPLISIYFCRWYIDICSYMEHIYFLKADRSSCGQ